METLGNLFRLAFRDVTIAVLGALCLIVGLASVLLVTVHLLYLNSYESHISRASDVYRVVVNLNSRSTGQPYELAFSSDAYAPLLESNYPQQIELTGKLTSFSRAMAFPDGETRELDFHFADESILEIFEFDFLEGDRRSLAMPYSIVVSRGFAERHFGNNEVVGATLLLNNSSLTVTGVFEDFPVNTHLQFEAVVSADTGRRLFGDEFLNRSPWILFQDTRTYIRLYPGTHASELVRDFDAFVERYIPDDERLLAQQARFRLDLQPIRQIHLNPREGGFNGVDNSIRTTLISLVVFAGTILTLAFVNYLFLSVSRLIRRSREIAIRRVIGASRRDLVQQFVGESAVVILLSLLCAIPLVYAVFPLYSHYVGIDLSINDIPFVGVLLVALLLMAVMSLVSAGFALYVISGEQGSDLKGGAYKSIKGLRASLAGSIFQVSLSLMLLILSASIYLHTRHLYQSDLGFNHDGLLIVDLRQSPSDRSLFDYSQLIADLSAGPYISGLTATTFHPGRVVGFLPWNSSAMEPEDTVATGYVIVDENFIDVYGLNLIEGRSLSGENSSDVMPSFSAPDGVYNTVITEYASSAFGFETPADALGETIESVAGTYTIVGVVDNFRFSSLQGNQNAPAVILASSRPMQYLNLRYDTQQEALVRRWLAGVLGAASVRNEFEYDLYRDVEIAAIDARAEGVSVAAMSSAMTSLLITVLGFVAVVLFLSSVKSSSTAVRRMLGAGALQALTPMLKDIGIVLLVSVVIAGVSVVFIERLVSSMLGASDVSLLFYVVLSVLVCVCFAVLALIVAFIHNRRVLGVLFSVRQ